MKILVTRHAALVEVLQQDFDLQFDTILSHIADPSVLDGNHVTGILPVNLAARCRSFTSLELNLPAELRGQELDADQVRQHMGSLVTYVVTRV